jgi:DNA-binding response OmpR family regulator
VTLAETGAAALTVPAVDLVLLDLGLPDLEGRVVCQELRSRGSVPIIVVTARGEEFDRVMLLELGADDYLVKPFGFRELVARMRAVLRRVHTDIAAPSPVITVGSLKIDQRTRAVSFESRPVVLTPKEYDLLVCLAADAGAVRSREQLIHDVWDENWWGSTKTLDVHVASLRKKLRPELIETVRTVGYRIVDAAPSGR